MNRCSVTLAALVLVLAAACSNKKVEPGHQEELGGGWTRTVDGPAGTLDGFHDAASKSDFDRYFAHMTADAVFLGTDATERWERREFEAFCRPYFSAGKGWTYRPRDRHINYASNGVAWFDELLENDNYGTCRGSGVLVKEADGPWRIAQYNLSMPVPNDLARDVVKMIRALPAKK